MLTESQAVAIAVALVESQEVISIQSGLKPCPEGHFLSHKLPWKDICFAP